MVKVKRSFLEKLTGARRLEDDIYDNNMIERKEQIIKPIHNLYEEEQETEMFVNSSPAPRQAAREESFSRSDDSEGQLTIDVYQTDNDIVIKSTIAGVKPEDLDVSINNDMITIRGERKQDEVVSAENYYYQECYWGSFSRSVILPIDVIPDKIEASMKNGILTIRMPKADNTRTKKIQVRGF
ncbi:MAG TPA: Hsp20/alpha crystallin family protein [Candidatus Moranbacteria bacterium]|nr:Hsp20/alpha crystallin family protein [Candidatus Moranbacteria bacterium]